MSTAGSALGAVTTSTGTVTGYRPAAWGAGKPLVMITVPVDGQTSSIADSPSQTQSGSVYLTTNVNVVANPGISYVFDGYPRVDHTLTAVATQQPTQTGAAITDHVYLEPRQLVVDIVMSDANDSYVAGQFSGGATKSIGAYAILKNIWYNRTAVTVTTRLDTYTNMVIVGLHAPDNEDTYNGLFCTVAFQEILYAQISTQNASQRPDANSTQTLGQVSTAPTSAGLEQQHNVTLPGSGVAASNVPGAGSYSSNVTGS